MSNATSADRTAASKERPGSLGDGPAFSADVDAGVAASAPDASAPEASAAAASERGRLVVAVLGRDESARAAERLRELDAKFVKLRERTGLLPFGGDEVLLVATRDANVGDVLRGLAAGIESDDEPEAVSLRGHALVLETLERWSD